MYTTLDKPRTTSQRAVLNTFCYWVISDEKKELLISLREALTESADMYSQKGYWPICWLTNEIRYGGVGV